MTAACDETLVAPRARHNWLIAGVEREQVLQIERSLDQVVTPLCLWIPPPYPATRAYVVADVSSMGWIPLPEAVLRGYRGGSLVHHAPPCPGCGSDVVLRLACLGFDLISRVHCDAPLALTRLPHLARSYDPLPGPGTALSPLGVFVSEYAYALWGLPDGRPTAWEAVRAFPRAERRVGQRPGEIAIATAERQPSTEWVASPNIDWFLATVRRHLYSAEVKDI